MPTISRAEDLAMVGINGGAWTVDLGSDAPVMPTDFSQPPTPWLAAGAISDAGLKVGFSETSTDFTPWGLTSPFRTTVTKSVRTFQIALWEVNRPIVKSVMFRLPLSAFTPAVSGLTSFAETASPQPDRRAWLFDVYDGLTMERYFVPSAEATARTDLTVKQDAMLAYEVTLTAYPDDAGNTVYHLCTVSITASGGGDGS